MTSFTETEKAIRAFSGPSNARLRRIIRNSLLADIDPRTITRHVALSTTGTAKLHAVYEAWQMEKTSERANNGTDTN